MAQTLAQLVARRDNISAQLDEMIENPQPNYSVDGQSVQWQSLYDSLWASLDKINAQIALIPWQNNCPAQSD